LPLVVALHNSGVRDVTGTLTINGLGDPIVTPDFAAAVGGAAQTVVAIEPDLLPAGEVIEVIYATSRPGPGEQGVVVTILPAAPHRFGNATIEARRAVSRRWSSSW
jgi:hypothetical protein